MPDPATPTTRTPPRSSASAPASARHGASVTASHPSRWARRAQWGIVALGGLLAWTLVMLAAIWQGPYLALFFPSGWCLYVALRQYRHLRGGD